MITNRNILQEYLEEDKKALRINKNRPGRYDIIWKYEIALRYNEYHFNVRNNRGGVYSIFHKVMHKIWDYRMFRLGLKTGYGICLNSCGKGLQLAHIGPIIINGKLGDYCRVHVGVNLGVQAGTSDQKPTIGNGVYIGPGAKIFGNITIADHIAIGANAVVNKSFYESGITIGGIPAKKISNKSAKGLLYEP